MAVHSANYFTECITEISISTCYGVRGWPSGLIAECLSAKQLILQRRPRSELAFVYIYVAIVSHTQECNYWLRLKQVRCYILVPCGHVCTVSGMQVSGWLLKFYLPRGTRVARPWRSMNEGVLSLGLARTATLWSQTVNTRHLYTAAPHQMMTRWLGLGKEARLWVSGAVRVCSAKAASCRVEKWVWSTSSTLSNSLSIHLQAPVRQATPTHAARGRHDADMYS